VSLTAIRWTNRRSLPNFPVTGLFHRAAGGAQLQQTIPGAAEGGAPDLSELLTLESRVPDRFLELRQPRARLVCLWKGTVSRDGKQVIPDAGVVIHEFSGARVRYPPPPPSIGPNGFLRGKRSGQRRRSR